MPGLVSLSAVETRVAFSSTVEEEQEEKAGEEGEDPRMAGEDFPYELSSDHWSREEKNQVTMRH